MGMLKIDAKDGSGKKIECNNLMLYGDSGLYYLKNTADIKIPTGKYELGSVTIQPKQNGPKEKWFGVNIRSEKPFIVNKDQTTTLSIGGPLAIKIDSPSSIKQDQELSVNLSFTAGKDQTGGFEGGQAPKITIKNAKGKVMKAGNAEFG
jgi:hypothetical protein